MRTVAQAEIEKLVPGVVFALSFSKPNEAALMLPEVGGSCDKYWGIYGLGRFSSL